jgi:uncharacterized protein (DUF362 family)
MPPFHPPEPYPEYPFDDGEFQPGNHVYAAVRSLFQRLKMDAPNFGTPHWNPLGEIIKPGDKVVIKPNLVISEHELGLEGLEASTVHGSVIRPFLDYVFIALKGMGRITIGDSPIKEVDFDKITSLMGVKDLVQYFWRQHPEVPLELVDYRDLKAYRREDGTIVGTSPLSGDSRGYTVVDLKEDSLLHEIARHHKRFRSTAAVYENVINEVHNLETHKYSFAKTVIESDVFICLAKMKTHRKAGVTLSLKNLVGLTNEKRWLPHHRVGTVSEGGDMLPDDAPLAKKVRERLVELFKTTPLGKYGFTYLLPMIQRIYNLGFNRVVDAVEKKESLSWGEGDWHGNDTIWRTVLDLNQILLFTDRKGVLHDKPQKRYFTCVDGIIAGEKEGPLHPVPKKVGLLVGGFNPVAVDLVCIRLMGYDYRKIPIMRGIDRMRRSLTFGKSVDKLWNDIDVVSNVARFSDLQRSVDNFYSFEASRGWKGHLELDEHK